MSSGRSDEPSRGSIRRLRLHGRGAWPSGARDSELVADRPAVPRQDGGPTDGPRSHDQTTAALPILMYHRVAPEGPDQTTRWRLTPPAFEEQLRWLADEGYMSATLEEWRGAAHRRRPLPGRRVLITFDDGYEDFADYAWPLLRRWGFGAILFVVSGEVGADSGWDRDLAPPVPLLGWDRLRRLVADGLEIGGHSATHPYLTALSPERIVREAAECRQAVRRELGIRARAFAYPFGDTDRAVAHLIGACGYQFGLTSSSGLAQLAGSLLMLPRLEVRGDGDPGLLVDLLAIDG